MIRAIKAIFRYVFFKHKYASLVAVGITIFSALILLAGIPLFVSHQEAIASMSMSLKSHPLLFLFLHILILISIYLAFSLWIDHLIQKNGAAAENKEAAVKFLRIFIGSLAVIMIAGMAVGHV